VGQKPAMNGLFAALPMYDWPEVRAETDATWAVLRDRLQEMGIVAPEKLARRNADLPPVPGGIRGPDGEKIAPDPADLPPNGFDLDTLLRHPGLIFGQTCWGPLEQGLEAHVALLGQPDYSAFEGGDGELYSSAIVTREPLLVRRWEDVDRGLRFAFNGPDSMSGLLAVQRDLAAAGRSVAIFREMVETGSHRASIVAVAEGRADLCAVDCRTWDLAKRFEPSAKSLHVAGWTSKRKGLPFVTSRHTPANVARALRLCLAPLTAA
jgi:ABC-type phosphate/phosphonate transport system substrate-binding protein